MTAESTGDPSPWRTLWNLPDDVVYLNHGSFGPSPKVVQESYERWTRQLERQPMNFFLREMEPALEDALAVLAKFVGTSRGNLVFVDNATFGMNVVAASIRLQTGDEVLVNDHEYGAVTRLWRRTCQQSRARLVTHELQQQLDDPATLVDDLLKAVTPRTRLIVVSHVTSPTAMIVPVEEVCRRARERNIPVCIDGPHAVGMLPLDLRKIDCDFYTASCHKWLSAPFGSGFLFVAPRQQKRVKPAVVSWGGSIGGRQPSWKDEFNWLGTRNPAAFLATADAIRFMQSTPPSLEISSPVPPEIDDELTVLDKFRAGSMKLIDHAIEEIGPAIGLQPVIQAPELRSGSMISFALPKEFSENISEVGKAGQTHPLQGWLWRTRRIEIPVIHWNKQLLIRVSSHLYNSRTETCYLSDSLRDYTLGK